MTKEINIKAGPSQSFLTARFDTRGRFQQNTWSSSIDLNYYCTQVGFNLKGSLIRSEQYDDHITFRYLHCV